MSLVLFTVILILIVLSLKPDSRPAWKLDEDQLNTLNYIQDPNGRKNFIQYATKANQERIDRREKMWNTITKFGRKS